MFQHPPAYVVKVNYQPFKNQIVKTTLMLNYEKKCTPH